MCNSRPSAASSRDASRTPRPHKHAVAATAMLHPVYTYTCLLHHVYTYTCLLHPVYTYTCLLHPVYTYTCLLHPVYTYTCLFHHVYTCLLHPIHTCYLSVLASRAHVSHSPHHVTVLQLRAHQRGVEGKQRLAQRPCYPRGLARVWGQLRARVV